MGKRGGRERIEVAAAARSMPGKEGDWVRRQASEPPDEHIRGYVLLGRENGIPYYIAEKDARGDYAKDQ